MKENIQADQYDLVVNDQQYIIYHQDQPLKTKGGNIFSHSNERMMKHLLTGFQLGDDQKPDGVTPAKLFEYYKDLNESEDFLNHDFEKIAAADPFIILKTSGEKKFVKHEITESARSVEADELRINLAFWSFSSILKNLNTFIEENIQHSEILEDHENPLIFILKQQYLQASQEKKSAVQLLCKVHQTGIVLPLLLIYGKLTLSEYAKGVFSLQTRDGNPKNLSLLFTETAIVSDFLSYFELPVSSGNEVREMIAAGEGIQIEFKSTLRWDLRAGKTNPAIERASLKTICAFLNSNGGNLIIGIRDDGSVEGIESDKLANDDRFLLHLWTLIRTCLGRDVSPYIQTKMEKIEEKTICVVSCSRSNRPVYLRQPGFDEEFYIRLGPASASLDISEALKYIGDRFNRSE